MSGPPPAGVHLTHLRRFAYWMDSGIPIPYTKVRIGLDPILGLVPGLGDAAGAVLSGWILVEAARMGVPRSTMIRLVSNVAFDALAGTVPVLGDAVDVAMRANERNVRLLERHAEDPSRASVADRRGVGVVLGAALVGLLAIAATAIWLSIRLVGALLG